MSGDSGPSHAADPRKVDGGRLAEQPLGVLLDALAAKTPTPGGGAVAGMVLATAAALGRMVLAYSIGKRSLAAHDQINRERAEVLEGLQRQFLGLADEDMSAYGRLNALERLPAEHPDRARIQAALLDALAPPLRSAELAEEMRGLLASLVGSSNPNLASDLAIARDLTECGSRAALHNVEVNLSSLHEGEDRRAILARVQRLAARP